MIAIVPQFVIPPPYRVWCHYCEQGFMTLEEAAAHDKESLNKHRDVNAARMGQ